MNPSQPISLRFILPAAGFGLEANITVNAQSSSVWHTLEAEGAWRWRGPKDSTKEMEMAELRKQNAPLKEGSRLWNNSWPN